MLATNRIRWLAVQHSRELKASPQPACTSSLVSKNAQSKINCTCMVRKRKAVGKLQLYPPFLAFLNYLYETTWNTCESAPSQKGRRVRPVAARDRVTFLQCTQRDILGSDQCVIFFSYNTVSGSIYIVIQFSKKESKFGGKRPFFFVLPVDVSAPRTRCRCGGVHAATYFAAG